MTRWLFLQRRAQLALPGTKTGHMNALKDYVLSLLKEENQGKQYDLFKRVA